MILTAFAFHLAIAAQPPNSPPLLLMAAKPESSYALRCQRGPSGRRPPPRPPRRGRRHLRLGPGGLRAHENSLGHCCHKHIGRTPKQLRIRLRREKHLDAASTFYTMRTAQRSLRIALRRNSERINGWLHRGGYGTLEIRVRMPNNIGIYLIRGAARPRKGRTAVFRLLPNKYYPGRFQVVTGMVEP